MSVVRSCNDSAGFKLQGRDCALLADLYGHSILSRDQILGLGFFSSIQRLNMRMHKLAAQALVDRWIDPLTPSPASLYLPTLSAAPLISRVLKADLAIVREVIRHKVSPGALRHALQATNARIAFQRAVRSSHFKIEKWLPERRCRHEYSVRNHPHTWTRRVFKPDAFFTLLSTRASFNYFVEVDLGHASAAKIAQKLDSYRDYRREMFQPTYQAKKFRVLFITTGRERLVHLLKLANRCTEEPVLFTTFSDLEVSTINDSIYFDSRSAKPRLLTGGGHR